MPSRIWRSIARPGVRGSNTISLSAEAMQQSTAPGLAWLYDFVAALIKVRRASAREHLEMAGLDVQLMLYEENVRA